MCPIEPGLVEDWLATVGLGFLAYYAPELFTSIVGLSQQAEAPKYHQQDRSIGEKWKDFQQNPKDWEKIGEKLDPKQL
ncbi:MAG: hypothetical protein AB1567_12210 [bacterium]